MFTRLNLSALRTHLQTREPLQNALARVRDAKPLTKVTAAAATVALAGGTLLAVDSLDHGSPAPGPKPVASESAHPTPAPKETKTEAPKPPPAPPPPPPITNDVTQALQPQLTQLAPGIIQARSGSVTLVAADFTQPGVRFQLGGEPAPGHAPVASQALTANPNAKAAFNMQMFAFIPADQPPNIPLVAADGRSTRGLGVEGPAISNGKPYDPAMTFTNPGAAYAQFSNKGVQLVTDGSAPAPTAVDAVNVNMQTLANGHMLPMDASSSFISGAFGRTVIAGNQDGSKFYVAVTDASKGNGMSIPGITQELVNIVAAMPGWGPVAWVANEDGGGSSQIATSAGVVDQLGRPDPAMATIDFDPAAAAAGTTVDWEKTLAPVRNPKPRE